MDYKLITHLPYRLLKAKKSGLIPEKLDDGHFSLGIFGWGEYKPKHSRQILKTQSVKNQGNINTCVFNSTTVQKEIDEKKKLSVRSMVIYAKRKGWLSGDGFSTLINGQKVLRDFGIMDDIIDESITRWSKYSAGILNEVVASKNKISSYWEVRKRSEILKLLDEDKAVTTGMDWYTGFNQGGGFSKPWLITMKNGWKVGSHAVVIIGYDMNYQGKQVYIIQNSYGKFWGDSGKFYVEMSYLEGKNYGFLTNLDIHVDIGKFLNEYDGKNVKGDKSNSIYHIQGGKKKPYPNWSSFLAWNGKDNGFVNVPQDEIDAVDEGDIMDIKKSYYWKFLKQVKDDDVMNELLTILYKE